MIGMSWELAIGK